MEEQRKLAAILFTDIVGFSMRMGEDEKTGLQLLEKHDEILTPIIEGHQGTILKRMGDAIFAEFFSAVRAVECAVEIQQALHDYNSDKADSEKILIRIGIHVGDVVVKGDDLFGDGVNVAARIEPLADPGGIFISGAAHQAITSRKDIYARNLGVRDLKNIIQKHSIYKVYSDKKHWEEEAYLDKKAEALVTTKRRYQTVRGAAISLAIILVVMIGTLIYRAQRITETKFFMFDSVSPNVSQDTLALLTALIYDRMVQSPRVVTISMDNARKLATSAGLLLEPPVTSIGESERKSEISSYLSQLGRALGCEQLAQVIFEGDSDQLNWTVLTYDVHEDFLLFQHSSDQNWQQRIGSIANLASLDILKRVIAPLTGTIVQESRNEVLIDIGSKDGVTEGMTLTVVKPVPIDNGTFVRLFPLANASSGTEYNKTKRLCSFCGQPFEVINVGKTSSFEMSGEFTLSYFCNGYDIEVNMRAAGKGEINFTVAAITVEEINPRTTLCKVLNIWNVPLAEYFLQLDTSDPSYLPKVGDKVQQRL